MRRMVQSHCWMRAAAYDRCQYFPPRWKYLHVTLLSEKIPTTVSRRLCSSTKVATAHAAVSSSFRLWLQAATRSAEKNICVEMRLGRRRATSASVVATVDPSRKFAPRANGDASHEM